MSESTAVSVRESDAPVVPYSRQFTEGFITQVWSSFDQDTPEGKAAIVKYMDGADALKAGDNIGEVLTVQHILAHRVTVVDDDGVEVDADRIVLVSPDGKALACTSTGILRSLQTIVGLYGVPPFDPPLRLKLHQKDTRRGRRTFSLVPVVDVSKKK